MSQMLIAVVCTRKGEKGKVYLSADAVADAVSHTINLEPRIESKFVKTPNLRQIRQNLCPSKEHSGFGFNHMV